MYEILNNDSQTLIRGSTSEAIVFTNEIEDSAIEQIKTLCDEKALSGTNIRIMPDVHAGAGCVIGTTMLITDKVVPNLVGVDIGCGMAVRVYDKFNVDFEKLDNTIRNMVPSGFSVNDETQPLYGKTRLSKLAMPEINNISRVERSLGSLGGGNHFIELNESEDKLYLVIHSGSRNIGKQIAEYYQRLAKNKNREESTKDLEYVDGVDMDNYLNDMDIAQEFAYLNREQILENITNEMMWKHIDEFQTIHNYIDMNTMILRKGAISSKEGERVIIPMNMRDGSIIATGRGNAEWNYSAPHGAGRIMGRGAAKRLLDVNEFMDTMRGVWSSTVGINTIDESPMAYKSIDKIIDMAGDTIKIDKIIKPIYNYKAELENMRWT